MIPHNTQRWCIINKDFILRTIMETISKDAILCAPYLETKGKTKLIYRIRNKWEIIL